MSRNLLSNVQLIIETFIRHWVEPLLTNPNANRVLFLSLKTSKVGGLNESK